MDEIEDRLYDVAMALHSKRTGGAVDERSVEATWRALLRVYESIPEVASAPGRGR